MRGETGRGKAVGVRKRLSRDVFNDGHDVVVDFAAPIRVNVINELLTITG